MSKKVKQEKQHEIVGRKVYTPKSYHLCQFEGCKAPAMTPGCYCRDHAELVARAERALRIATDLDDAWGPNDW